MRPLIALLLAACASAQTLEERVQRLEERVGESPAPSAAKPNAVELWFDGHLRFATADGKFAGRLGGYFIEHLVLYDRLNESDQVDTFLVREAGIEVSARFDRSWEVYLDVGPQEGGSVRLIYGWVEFNRWEELRIRAGLFKEPISMETMEDTRWWDFLENSMLYMHDPLQDTGILAHGRAFDGLLSYAAGVFNGNGPAVRDENSDKDAVARVQVTPSAALEWEALKHLHVGLSATHGRQRRDNVTPFPFQDPATDTFFHRPAGPTDYEVEDLSRVRGDFALLLGPFEAKAEYSRLFADVDFAGDHERFKSSGWYGQLGVWIGGSRVPWGVPEVEKPLFQGGWGALQLAGRYARLRMDDDFEENAGFVGGRSIEEVAFIVNWFPGVHLRVSAQYLFVSYESREAVLPGGREIDKESVWIVRLQISF